MFHDTFNPLKEQTTNFKSMEAAEENLRKYLEYNPEINEGDLVELSEFGEMIVRYPKGNQVAMCVKKIELDNASNDGDAPMYDMIIAVALDEGIVKYFKVSTKHYKKRLSSTKNISFFKKKGGRC